MITQDDFKDFFVDPVEIVRSSMHIHRTREGLKVIELLGAHRALTGVPPACKPQALSCKASISEKSSSNEESSRRASHAEGGNIGQALRRIHLSSSI